MRRRPRLSSRIRTASQTLRAAWQVHPRRAVPDLPGRLVEVRSTWPSEQPPQGSGALLECNALDHCRKGAVHRDPAAQSRTAHARIPGCVREQPLATAPPCSELSRGGERDDMAYSASTKGSAASRRWATWI